MESVMRRGVVTRVGDATITTIIDAEEIPIPLTDLLPEANLERLRRHRSWLEPHHLDFSSAMAKLSMHSLLVQVDDCRILIDTCIGEDKERELHPAWHRRKASGYLKALSDLGLKPEDIDMVLCTHLHADHVGWNTRLEHGRWIPTFPRAKYLFSAQELAYWQERWARERPDFLSRGSYADSVLPILEKGLAHFVAPEDVISPGLQIVSLPGHTPNHVGLRLVRTHDQALLCGDAMHSLVQLAEPQWSSAFCTDPALSAVTRRALLAEAAANGAVLVPAHIRQTPAFRLQGTEGDYRLSLAD